MEQIYDNKSNMKLIGRLFTGRSEELSFGDCETEPNETSMVAWEREIWVVDLWPIMTNLWSASNAY